jgi:hypothetical protein
MGFMDKVRRIERRIEKLAARSDVALQPIEIRKAALDEVEDLVEPSGRSRRVFPYNRVTVEVVAAGARERAAVESVLGKGSDLGAAVAGRLREAGCAPVPAVDVRLKIARKPGSDWETGRVFRVLCDRVEPDAPPAAGPTAAGADSAQVVVIKGEATRRSYALTGERVNVGRLAEVLDKDKRVVRRNHVVFTDVDTAANRTVSRAHAHIGRTPSGDHRLFDDGSTHGTRLFRDGRTIAIPSGSPRGTTLRHGDEIFFGQAAVRYVVAPKA